jgi:hypothetical protein
MCIDTVYVKNDGLIKEAALKTRAEFFKQIGMMGGPGSWLQERVCCVLPGPRYRRDQLYNSI